MVEAVVAPDSATLNTNGRYLHEPLVELAERLMATMPGTASTRVLLVNSGSEANDLAWRIARRVHRRLGRASSPTSPTTASPTATLALSPEEWPAGYRPHGVETVAVDDTTRLGAETAAAVAACAIAASRPPRRTVDGGFTSDGVRSPPTPDVAAMVDGWREAGGLFVADEVQAGHGRTGRPHVAFQGFGITADFVTLGKPMGNGYPVAALITRAD